jgi:hypothetical protein
MSKEKKSRDRIITEWSYKDALGFVGPPIKPAAQHVYFKVLLLQWVNSQEKYIDIHCILNRTSTGIS